MQQLTESDQSVIVNALYTAAEKYRDCAKEISKSDLPTAAKDRLVSTFNKQADDVADVLAKLEG